MRKLKVMTILGTRPEIIRLSRVMARLDDYADHRLVHTGQNFDYELSEVFFEDLGVRRPDHFLGTGGGTLGETLGKILIESERVIAEERPEAERGNSVPPCQSIPNNACRSWSPG